MALKEVDIKGLSFNPCVDIEENWMLITAGDGSRHNAMADLLVSCLFNQLFYIPFIPRGSSKSSMRQSSAFARLQTDLA